MGKNLSKTYDPKDFEERIYKMWEESGSFHAEIDENKKPFTIVMPPPNITGQLHMGHALDQTLQDVLTRWKRMQGYSDELPRHLRPLPPGGQTKKFDWQENDGCDWPKLPPYS